MQTKQCRLFDVLLRRSIEALLYKQLREAGQDFFFVQIGANDGVSFDWTYKFVTANRVKGIVVEPLRDIFDELCENYKEHPQILPVNVAIHKTERNIELYRVDPKKSDVLPDWTKGIASVDYNHHRKSRTPSKFIISETVPCLTLSELVEQNNITRIDFLQIDVEGYDHEIIRMIDFDRLKPAIIRFEHHLDGGVMSRRDFLDCTEILINAGYGLIMDISDAVAYRQSS